ncbi:DUF934 domain-containing protein [Microbulbifer flavimaris]|uniref:DUF934 domain-containing protein n=1 Tax=Microbulbifer flavimaris TaxID=1781068 RepID=A0ABX4I2U5_9GAMM|nr:MULTISPECIES: DUF934 domain-containing protein [Microbulbifer]KUJ84652.1 oxidoreductase [Microbulbifer sp. ZGT114]PCO06740.1 DUF934 domain-containing protein [Microbulbifer flavimaris]
MPKPAKAQAPQPENPQQLILDGAVVNNEWHLIPSDESAADLSAATLASGRLMLPLAVWQELRGELTDRKSEIGVWLDSDETADLLGEAACELPLIAVHFPAFADGRGFTTGRLLRERYGFAGELRAIGNFMRDQLSYLSRCGFNAFAYQGDQSLEELLKSLRDFSQSYQAAVDQPEPLFRRRGLA